MLFSAPLALVALAISSVTASPVVTRGSSCPSGYTYGSVQNDIIIPASMSKINSIIKSWFNPTWEGMTLVSTTGKDNTPGATRTISFQGVLDLTEQMVHNYDLSPLYIDRLWIGSGGNTPNSLPVVAAAFNANLSSWTEHFTMLPACLGKATSISWSASFCSTNNAVATALYTEAHTGPYAGFTAQFGNYTTCAALLL